MVDLLKEQIKKYLEMPDLYLENVNNMAKNHVLAFSNAIDVSVTDIVLDANNSDSSLEQILSGIKAEINSWTCKDFELTESEKDNRHFLIIKACLILLVNEKENKIKEMAKSHEAENVSDEVLEQFREALRSALNSVILTLSEKIKSTHDKNKITLIQCGLKGFEEISKKLPQSSLDEAINEIKVVHSSLENALNKYQDEKGLLGRIRQWVGDAIRKILGKNYESGKLSVPGTLEYAKRKVDETVNHISTPRVSATLFNTKMQGNITNKTPTPLQHTRQRP